MTDQTADRPSVEDMLAQARSWPRDGFGEGLWFHAMADEIEKAHADLELLARSGCRVREYNGRRFVEIVSDV